MFGNAVQRRRASVPRALLLGAFDLLPVGPDLVDILDAHITEHMRMAADQFVGDVTRHLVEIERAAFAAQLAMEDDLQQQIAEFLGQFMIIARFDGIDQFVDFFDRMPAQRTMILFPVPGAAVRRAQLGHHFQ